MRVPAPRPGPPPRLPDAERPRARWAREAEGRLFPFCRLDPAEEPVAEAERCLALGARGIKLHPRAQSFGFGNAAAAAIFEVARDAGVPILIHAGRGMPRMDPLADLALRYPEVPLVLAHAAIADQGMFAARLAGHPSRRLRHVLLLGAGHHRVVRSRSRGADRVRLRHALRAARRRPVSDAPRRRLRRSRRRRAGSRRRGHDGRASSSGRAARAGPATRVAQVRPINGRLARLGGYLLMGFAAVMGIEAAARFGAGAARASPSPAQCVATLTRAAAGPALARIDAPARRRGAVDRRRATSSHSSPSDSSWRPARSPRPSRWPRIDGRGAVGLAPWRPPLAAPRRRKRRPPERGEEQPSRSARRDQLAREALAPLAPGERPPRCSPRRRVAGLLGGGNAIAYAAGATIAGKHPGAGVLAFSGLMALLAGGMWARRYLAVLAFEALLALDRARSSRCSSSRPRTSRRSCCASAVIGGGGWLFWKLVRVMGRLAPRRRQLIVGLRRAASVLALRSGALGGQAPLARARRSAASGAAGGARAAPRRASSRSRSSASSRLRSWLRASCATAVTRGPSRSSSARGAARR